ncbi:MAG: hypothetical protein R3F04_01225 [Lysobacteraceae bacterium]
MREFSKITYCGAAILLLVGTGCSRQAWYAGMQQSARDDCLRQPPGEIERCEAHLNRMHFDDYERDRERRPQP